MDYNNAMNGLYFWGAIIGILILPLSFVFMFFGLPLLLAYGLTLIVVSLWFILAFVVFVNKKRHQSNFMRFIKGGVINSFSIYASLFILTKLKLTDTLAIVLLTGIAMSLIASFVTNLIENRYFKFKIFLTNFVLYSALYWLIRFYLLQSIQIANLSVRIVFIGFLISGIISLIIGLTKKNRGYNRR